MNWWLLLAAILILVIVAILFIIRDAITIDGTKAKAALAAFAARFKRGG